MDNQPISPNLVISPEFNPAARRSVLPFILGAVLISAIIFGLLGYYLGQQASTSEQKVEAPVIKDDTSVSGQASMPALESSPPTQQTNGLITYSNTNAGLSFMYSSELEADAEVGISGPTTVKGVPVTTFANEATIRPNTDAPFDGFAIYEFDLGTLPSTTYEQFVNNELNAYINSPRGNHQASLQKQQIGTNEFLVIKAHASPVAYFIPGTERIVMFYPSFANASFIEEFEDMLSTLRLNK